MYVPTNQDVSENVHFGHILESKPLWMRAMYSYSASSKIYKAKRVTQPKEFNYNTVYEEFI